MIRLGDLPEFKALLDSGLIPEPMPEVTEPPIRLGDMVTLGDGGTVMAYGRVVEIEANRAVLNTGEAFTFKETNRA